MADPALEAQTDPAPDPQAGPAAAPLADEGLLVHERSLAVKVGAGSEAAEIVDQQLLLLGTNLVTQLNVLLKLTRSHGGTNAAMERPVAAILTLVRALGVERPVALRMQEGFVYLNDRHLRAGTLHLTIFTSFFAGLQALGIGGLSLRATVTGPGLRRFAALVAASAPGPQAIEALRAALEAEGEGAIELELPRWVAKDEAPELHQQAPAAEGDPAVRFRSRSRGAVVEAGTALATLDTGARAHGTLSFRVAKRAIQNIVDLLLEDPSTLLGLTTLRAHDEYTQRHSVNVALLSMALANRVGYSKLALADLGLAALFHDVGKCAVPLDVLNKPGAFTAEEWGVMKTHPSEGVLSLLSLRGLAQVPMRMAAASFEHHLAADGTGYPVLREPRRQLLSSRVICIADCYDAMTSARVYRRTPLAPPEVLGYMLQKSGALFDPVLLKHFVSCVGIIPMGTLLLLDNGELAVAVKPAPEREHAQRPLVRAICDPSGAPLDPPPEYDLREKDERGIFKRSVVKLVDNTKHRLETSRWVSP